MQAVESHKSFFQTIRFDEKIQKGYVSLQWRVMQNFEEKLNLGSKKDMINLVNFHPATQSPKILP